MDFSFEKDIILENERVLIRPMLITDKDSLLQIATEDKTLLQYSPSEIHTESLLQKYIEIALSDRFNKVRYAFVIYDKQNKLYAGSTSFGSIANSDKGIQIGWTWIGRQFQKTGLNRNCKYLLMSYVFDSLQFERLEFRADERNGDSRKAIERIGGKMEGILRSHMLMNDGFRRNTVCYSILRSEWTQVKANLQIR